MILSQMEQYSGSLSDIFQALADPTRRAVLARLAQGPASVGELARPFDMALPSFLKHLRVLEESGWIHSHKTGRVRTCTLEPRALGEVADWLSEQRALWEARTDRFEQFVTQQEAEKEAKETPK
jgi:DNA-binding transcriptional ArsR family regulator